VGRLAGLNQDQTGWSGWSVLDRLAWHRNCVENAPLSLPILAVRLYPNPK
jgi:hypothetical protein